MPKRSNSVVPDPLPEPALSGVANDLLERALVELLKHGLGDGSLRAMAARLSTSHRMLIYYFGSGDAFWDALLTRIRQAELESRLIETASEGDIEALVLVVWRRYSAPDYLPIMKLLFQLYGRAIRDPVRFQHFLNEVVASWLEPLEQVLLATKKIRREQVSPLARLGLAALRGLFLDLITTNDYAGTTAAAELLARNMKSFK